MKINAYVKNRGPLVTSKPLPSSPPLQGGRGLAEHPLIFHHQRVFGSRENGKENEIKWRKEEAAAKLPLSIADVK